MNPDAPRCPTCHLAVASASEVVIGFARYSDTLGGHADRHTLVAETAERVVA